MNEHLAWKQALDEADARAHRAFEKSLEQDKAIVAQRVMIAYATELLEDVVKTEAMDEGLRMRVVSWLQVLDNAKQEGEI